MATGIFKFIYATYSFKQLFSKRIFHQNFDCTSCFLYELPKQLVYLWFNSMLPVQDNTNTDEMWTDIQTLNGIRTQEPSVWAGKDISCLRPCGHCDHMDISWVVQITTFLTTQDFLLVCYLMTSPVMRLYSIDDRMINEYGAVGEWEFLEETEIFGENLTHCHFVHHKSHMNRTGIKPGLPQWEAASNCLSYGMAP
jgi:hypothetical protein